MEKEKIKKKKKINYFENQTNMKKIEINKFLKDKKFKKLIKD